MDDFLLKVEKGGPYRVYGPTISQSNCRKAGPYHCHLIILFMHQSIPSTNIPSRATPGVLHSTAAPGPEFILDDLPRGPGFCISIKLRLVQ